MIRKEKLSIKDLADLVKFSLTPNAFWEGLPEKMTIKQFCLALAKEMDYQRLKRWITRENEI